MAFLTVDDKYGEIEVIAFARQYAEFGGLLSEDSAVIIEGNISDGEEEGVKIILSSAKALISNGDFENTSKKDEEKKNPRLYIRVLGRNDKRLDKLYRIAALNPGNTEVVLYDTESEKYSLIKDFRINPVREVIERLSGIFSSENVILR